MNKQQLERVLRAVETFDRASQKYGSDNYGAIAGQVNSHEVFKARRLYKAAKTRLVNMLKDIERDDNQPTVPSFFAENYE